MSCEDDVQQSSAIPDRQRTQLSRCYRVLELTKMSEMRPSTMLIGHRVQQYDSALEDNVGKR
jgi:hypothetical protein